MPVEIAGFSVEQSDAETKIVIPSDASPFPDVDTWIDALLLLIEDKPWMTALLSSSNIVQGKKWIANPVRALVKPQNS